MPYETSTYAGDDTFSIDCTGDAVVGDVVRFERATFAGSFRNAKFAGFELVTGKIVRDSYGRDKQQHTFSLSVKKTDFKGSEYETTILIKGRNLYQNGVWRQLWADEAQRMKARDEKHARGDSARRIRRARLREEG